MNKNEAIEPIKRGIRTEAKWPGTEEMIKALEMVISVLHAQVEKDEPLTMEELREMVGSPVYIVRLDIEQTPLQYYPAVVFGWRFEDPFADSMDFNKRIQEVTVIQPSAFAGNTQFWTEKTYGKYWLAYRRKPKEDNNA